MGRTYATLGELWAVQSSERQRFYDANEAWWSAGGYCGSTVECAMIGDDASDADVATSIRFLEGLLSRTPGLRLQTVLDAGAGVGRVTKQVLLKRCAECHLLEACPEWSKQSRRYLGKKRAAACTFIQARVETYVPPPNMYDLVWVQWVLQYLVDSDAIAALQQAPPPPRSPCLAASKA